VKNYFRIILLLLVSFFCCSSFAAKGRKHIRWSPQAVAWAITTVEFESNRNILDSLAGAEGGDQTLEALKSFAEPGNALYQWVKEKLSRQSYKFNWDFFSWLIDICESLIELGNLSSPTQIMTAIINGKEWENFLSAKELDIESFLVDRSWETIGFKNSIVKYFASVMHRR